MSMLSIQEALNVISSETLTYNTWVNISASALVKTGTGVLAGIVINSHSSGTLKLWDSLDASTTVLCNTITFGVGEHFIPMFDLTFATGLYATIGGTADITIVYR